MATPLDLTRFDQHPCGVILAERDGSIRYANEAACLLLGLDLDEVVGHPMEELDELLGQQIEHIVREGAPLLGSRLRVGGQTLACEMVPVFSEDYITSVITYLKPLAPELESRPAPESTTEMARQLDAIMESSFDGLWITNQGGMVVRLNRAALRLVGLPREEVEGRYVGDLLKEGNFSESVTLEVLRRRTTVTMVQKLKTGKKVLATGSPIFDADGEIAFVIINDRDITLLDRLRQRIEESEAQLEHYRSELSLKQLQEIQSDYWLCQSAAMQAVYQEALRVAPTNSTVLVAGDSGVGKGVLAKLIHRRSSRAGGPFVRVDCAAIPSSIFESEMFGYASGAFTGAGRRGKSGLVELANGGTLFLDEVAEISLGDQVKLLRFLDEKRMIPVGGSLEKEVDTRVVAATNKDLAEEVRAGRFRRDLFYRFNVVPLIIPPLRERQKDIMHLIRFFLRKVGEENGIFKDLSPEARSRLMDYSYPGNVRELENIIERMLILSRGDCIEVDDLPVEVRSATAGSLELDLQEDLNLPERIKLLEVRIIQDAVKRFGSHRRAARHLGISQSSVSRKLRQTGIDSDMNQ